MKHIRFFSRVAAEAAGALARVGGDLDTAETRVWRAAGGCPAGCEAWWLPAGLVLLGFVPPSLWWAGASLRFSGGGTEPREFQVSLSIAKPQC